LRTNRWLVVGAATGVMATLGALYSWSLFGQLLGAGLGWSHTQVTGAFSWAIFFVGVGAMTGGRWLNKTGPRLITTTGVSLWGVGNVLAGLGTARLGPIWLYLTYGVVGGFGVGLAYVTPVATAIKWFPDRPGLAGGLVAMGFGLGTIAANLILGAIPSFTGVAVSGAAPEQVRVASEALWYSGITFLALGLPCANYMRNPSALPQASRVSSQAEGSFNTAEMIRTPQFFLLWLMFFTNVTAGILLIANVLPVIEELTHATPYLAAKLYTGAAVANAAGRLFWGGVSDRIGHNRTYAALFGIQALAFVAMSNSHSLASLGLALTTILLCFGGGFGVMPSFNTRYFGTAHMGANYGVLLTAWGCAGIAGPLMAAKVADVAGSFAHALNSVAVVLVVAIVLPALSRKPRLPRLLLGEGGQ
jgi:OFA family oxalate/formate antiporter-like MFS transporter